MNKLMIFVVLTIALAIVARCLADHYLLPILCEKGIQDAEKIKSELNNTQAEYNNSTIETKDSNRQFSSISTIVFLWTNKRKRYVCC